MSKKRKNSVFWEASRRLCDRMRLSELPRMANAWYEKSNARFLEGHFGFLGDDGYDRSGWQYRLRRFGMKMREESFLGQLWNRAGNYLLESSVGYVGLWLLLTGLSLLILSLIKGGGNPDTEELHACALLLLLSVPLVGATRPFSQILGESRILRKFLFDFCGLSSALFGTGGRGAARPMGVLVCAALATLVGGLLSVRIFCFLLLTLLVLLLLFACPELTLLLLLAVFPLLQLSAHPTAYLCILALLVHLTYFLKAYCGRRDFYLELADLPVLLFCILLFFGGIFGYGNMRDGMILSVLASLYFPARHLLTPMRWRRRARGTLLWGGLVCSFLGAYQYFFTDLPLLWVDSDRFSDLGGRVTGFFENPNVLGIYLLLLFPMAACAFLDRRERICARVFFFLGSLSILLCAVLTWSRGAWLAILAELILILLFHDRKTSPILPFFPIFGAALLPFLPSNLLRRFASIASFADSSVRYRLYTWKGVLRMLGEHPFGIGVGESAFHRIYPQYAVSGIETVMHAHQVFLQLAAEVGVAGTVLFAFILLLGIAKGIGKRASFGGAYALCGATVMGMFDHLWYEAGMIALLFVIAALAVGEEERNE